MRPVVDGIEREFGADAHVMSVNLQTPVGRDIAALYDIEAVPSFVVLDGAGEVRFRVDGRVQSRKTLVAALRN